MALRLTGGDELRDRLGHGWTGLRDLGEAALLEQERHGLAQIADRTRDRAIGDGAEDVLALELEEVADLVEDRGDTFVIERGGIPGHDPMLAAGHFINASRSVVAISASMS